MIKKFLLIYLFSLGSVFAMSLEDYDISKSWEGAVVHVPGKFFPTRVNKIQVDNPLPVVVLMHGCAGIGQEENHWSSLLKSNGFIVVLPDSFAIPGRISNCSPAAHVTNLGKVPVNDLRPLEVAYAMDRVKSAGWAIKDAIYLMGHSEGAMAATLTADMGFKGLIISGYICTFGIKSSLETPILVVAWDVDPYFKNRGFQCDSRWGARTNGRLELLPGTGHGTASSSAARKAVIDFLKKN